MKPSAQREQEFHRTNLHSNKRRDDIVKTLWLQRAKNQKERAELKKTILGSQHVLKLLQEILEDKLIESLTVYETDYETSSWAFKEAHNHGKREALTDVLNLLDLEADDPLQKKRKRKALTDARINKSKQP